MYVRDLCKTLGEHSGHHEEVLGVEPVCQLSKEMNSPSSDHVQVPLEFVVEPCCICWIYLPLGFFHCTVSQRNVATVLIVASKEEFIYVCGSSAVLDDSGLPCTFELE